MHTLEKSDFVLFEDYSDAEFDALVQYYDQLQTGFYEILEARVGRFTARNAYYEDDVLDVFLFDESEPVPDPGEVFYLAIGQKDGRWEILAAAPSYTLDVDEIAN